MNDNVEVTAIVFIRFDEVIATPECSETSHCFVHLDVGSTVQSRKIKVFCKSMRLHSNGKSGLIPDSSVCLL